MLLSCFIICSPSYQDLCQQVVKMGVVGSELVDFCEDDLRGLGLTVCSNFMGIFRLRKNLY